MGIATASAWEPVIGLEVHVQLLTQSKIFCGCPTRFGSPPNRSTCPVCLGHPGTLPVLNRQAVTLALRLALSVGARVAKTAIFARKNYFYPDLPKGYQISQYERPLAEGGTIALPDGRSIRLVRIHMEEDAGKLLHEGPGTDDHALIDFNRSGVPLVEVVSEPDLRTPAEARSYLEALHLLVTHLGICDGNMEEGSLRCDANVSVHRHGARLGTRTEIKNLNSFRNVEKALALEIERHTEKLDRGETVEQETRGFDADRLATYSMRGKEEAHDYRYFPEPDLVPLQIEATLLDEVQASLPELPAARRSRFMEIYGLSAYDAALLCEDRELADYFEGVAHASGNPKAAANWCLRDVKREVKGRAGGVASFPVPPASLAAMVRMIDEGAISATAGRDVFAGMMETGDAPEAVAQAKGLLQVSDVSELEAAVRAVLEHERDAVSSYRTGKGKSFGFLVGAVMKRTAGRANPKLVNEVLKRILAAPC